MARKDDIVRDLNNICSGESKISAVTAHKIFEAISWEWTENRDVNGNFPKSGNGYFGCTYWSKKALDAVFDENSKRRKNINLRKTVTHEHVVPKNLFIKYFDQLFEERTCCNFTVKDIDKMLVGCIVTKAEAKALGCKRFANVERKMPEGIAFPPITNDDVWSRYNLVNNLIKDEPCKTCTSRCEKYDECSMLEKIEVYEVVWEKSKKKLTISEKNPLWRTRC